MDQKTPIPKISLILVCGEGASDLVVPLTGLTRQTIVSEIELILIAEPGALEPDLGKKYPQFHSVQVLDYQMPAWRGIAAEIGVRAANAPVIGFHENHTMAEPQMYEMMLGDLKEDTVAVAPVFYIANPERVWANAIFIVTHGHSAPEVPEGPKEGLVNHQAIYRAEVLKPRASELKQENALQAELARDAGKLRFCREAVMWHIESADARTCLNIAYVMGRQFGWSRSRDWSIFKKSVRFAAVPAIVGISALRYVRRMMEIQETPRQKVAVAGCLFLMGIAFGVGEGIGYFIRNDPWPSWVEEHEFHILKRLDGTMPQKPAIRDAISALMAVQTG